MVSKPAEATELSKQRRLLLSERHTFVYCTLFTSLRFSRLGKLKAHVKARVKKNDFKVRRVI